MRLWEYVDKNVRLVLEDGTSITGKVIDWYDGYDLDGADEIVIGDHSYPENIIKEIKIISAQFELGAFTCKNTMGKHRMVLFL